jgi:cytochrome b subunit of formate dehydrogenase
VVLFLLFPLMVWTGLAMSPAITSAWPTIVTVWGGHQSARTLHFFVAIALVLFVLVHLAMVIRAGFTRSNASHDHRQPASCRRNDEQTVTAQPAHGRWTGDSRRLGARCSGPVGESLWPYLPGTTEACLAPAKP